MTDGDSLTPAENDEIDRAFADALERKRVAAADAHETLVGEIQTAMRRDQDILDAGREAARREGLAARTQRADEQDPQPPMTARAEGPIATSEQARDAYARLKSDRKAAHELGVSKTHFRRLRGVQR